MTASIYAIVRSSDGAVTNVAMFDPTNPLPSFAGFSLIPTNGAPVDSTYTWNGTAFVPPVAPAPTLAAVQATQLATLYAACNSQITGGYQSSALGAPHTYPSTDTDQTNMTASVVASLIPGLPSTWTTPFWCADATGNWSLAAHTVAQIQQAGSDGKAFIVAAQTKLKGLVAQVSAATSISTVQAITW
jgi:hypothetical protein